MIKAGIFDIGGVLIEWNDTWLIDDIKNTLSISEDIARSCWEKYLHPLSRGEIDEQEFWRLFCIESGADVLKSSHDLMMREFIKRYHPDERVFLIAQTMKKNGYRIVILSNSIEPHLTYLRSQSIDQDFEFAIYSSEVGVEKPAKEIYEIILEKLALPADETMFIDNLTKNVEAANDLGIHGIHFENPEKLRKDIEDLGVNLT